MVVVRHVFSGLVGALLLAAPLAAQAPTGIISGRVVDSTTQQPLPGVAIVIEGTRRGAITGDDGRFALSGVPAGTHSLRVRRIGYASEAQSVTVAAGAMATVVFALDRRVTVLEEVVTTGYGEQRRLAVTGSIATIDADAANVGVITSVDQMLQGRAAGVHLTQPSGEPGAWPWIRIRGGTSISAGNDPLYVIDGIPINNHATEPQGFDIGGRDSPSLARNPMNLLNPNDISSITILKDASATAIYGARGANGVILVETKRGAGSGGPTMEYEFYAGRSSPYKYLEVLDGDQYRQFVQQQVTAGNLPASSLTSLGTANTDWERAVTHSSTTFNHNLSFAGGSENTQYRASANYMNQQGVVLNNGLRRYQARLNGTHNTLQGRLRLGLNLTGSHVKNRYLQYENTGGFEGGVFTNMVSFNPTRPVTVTDPATGTVTYYELGAGSQSSRNPVALAEQIQDEGTTTRTLANASAELDLLSNLTARVNVGLDRSEGIRGSYWPIVSPVGAAYPGRARQANLDNTSKTLQTLLTFRPGFGADHTIDVVGGYEYNENTLSRFTAEARGFLTDAFSYNRLESGSISVPPTAYREDANLVSFFSRANYGFRDRYFLTGSLRRDGSSRFGAGNKWAVFPGISGSWRLSEEAFFPRGPFSELRLRAGWGKQGNEAVPAYASLILLSADGGSRYVFGEQAVTGFAPISNPNPNLKWEESTQSTFGLDYGFLDNRFSGTIEYYVKNTQDLLLRVDVPQPAVAGTRLENIGRLRNRGFEFSLNGPVLDRANLNWTAGLVFAAERGEVVDLGGRTFIATGDVSGQGQSGQRAQGVIPGHPLGTFWGPEFIGINAAGQQEFNKYTVTRDAKGREISRVLAGKTTAPGGDDKVVIGDANPSFTLGLTSQVTFRKFDLSFLINSQQGLDVFNNTALVYATKGNAKQSKNFLASALNDGVDIDEPQIFSSRWIEDGSFVRLQNVTVGYTLDLPRFTGTARKARVFLSADNLLLLTDYSGYDPEVHTEAPIDGVAARGIDYLTYPRPRTITGGFRVAF